MRGSHSAGDTPFLMGANLPWVRYGCDFGANAWQPGGGLSRRPDLPQLAERLAHIAARGVTALRWFVFCDGRSGIIFARDGTPEGLDAAVFDDVDAAVALARTARVQLLPVLFDFHWCRRGRTVRGVRLGGRAAVLRSTRQTEELLARVVEPILLRYGREPSILGWDLFNEPEWVTMGYGRWWPWHAVTSGRMRSFLAAAASLVHARTDQLVTVGSASAHWLDLVRGLGVDVYQPHWYDALDRRSPLEAPLASRNLDRPAWLGEWPTRGSARSTMDVYALARRAGYSGAWFWSVMAGDHHTDYAAAASALEARKTDEGDTRS